VGQLIGFSLLCGTLLLIGIDLRLSYTRMHRFGPQVELNPFAKKMALEHGISAGIATLLILNLAILAIVSVHPTLLAILFGAKLGLASLQARSLLEQKETK